MPFVAAHAWDASSNPLGVASPTYTIITRTGAAWGGSNVLVNMSGGAYRLELSEAAAVEGVIVLWDMGEGAFPRRQVTTLAQDGLFAVLLTNLDGELYAGAGEPEFGLYTSDPEAGGLVNPPELTNPNIDGEPQAYLWIGEVPGADVLAGAVMRIDPPADALGQVAGLASEGDFAPGVAPEISELVPPDGTEIQRTTTFSFKILDADGDLRRAHVFAFYPATGAFEVVFWDAAIEGYRDAGFSPKYTGTRSAIDGGYQFSGVIRKGGWPSRVVLVTDPRDATGQEST